MSGNVIPPIIYVDNEGDGMSVTMASEGKKIMMPPFVPYERRAYFYSLLAAYLEISVQIPYVTTLDHLRQVLKYVSSSASACFLKEKGKKSNMLSALERSAGDDTMPLDVFAMAFGILTVSEQIMLETIGNQQTVDGMVKGLRSLALLVVSEVP